MYTFIKIIFAVLSISLYSCMTTKGTHNKSSSKKIADEQMKEKGYEKGTITASKNKECSYILTVEKYPDTMDPINLQEFFKSDIPEKVWVKYSNLRMNNRCSEGRPISITEIMKREDS